MTGYCHICARPLSVDADPMSGDCGGDCWGCVGEIEALGSPEGNPSIVYVAEEIAKGWRNPDGSAKPPSAFGLEQ